MKKLINNNRFLSLIIGLVLAAFLTSCSKDTAGGEEVGKKPLSEEPTKDVNSYFDKIKDENNLEGNFPFVNRYYFDENKNVKPEPSDYFLRKVTFDSNMDEKDVEYNMYYTKSKYDKENKFVGNEFSIKIFKDDLKKSAMWNVDTREYYYMSLKIKTSNNDFITGYCLLNYYWHNGYYKELKTRFNNKITHLYLYKTSVTGSATKENAAHELYILIENPTKEKIKEIEDYKGIVFKRGGFHSEEDKKFISLHEYKNIYWGF